MTDDTTHGTTEDAPRTTPARKAATGATDTAATDAAAAEGSAGKPIRRRAVSAAGSRVKAQVAKVPRPVRPRAPARERVVVVSAAEADSTPRHHQLGHAEAEHIDVLQGSIGSAMARSVAVTQGAIGGARADVVTVTQGALGGARAQHVTVEKGMLGGALAGEVSVRQGYVQGVIARDVSIEQGGARTVFANHVTFGRQSGAFVVIAKTVDGQVRTIVDWRGALAFGAALALVSAFLRRRIRGR